MKTMEPVQDSTFPFAWTDVEFLRNSRAERREIYLRDDEEPVTGLMLLFHSLFAGIKDHLLVYDQSWWDLCLGTWDIATDSYDYNAPHLGRETKDYLQLLRNAAIPAGYSGSCRCHNWDSFLPVVLRCITSHVAPYSPLCYSTTDDLFFYFHYTGSIGIYFGTPNKTMGDILSLAQQLYDVR